MNVLVVGGAGYIGSHCVRQLQSAGHSPFVLDNLVYGHRAAVADDIPFFDEDLGNRTAVAKILTENQIDVVMHFAAYINVGESVNVPLKYYENNVGNTIQLLLAMTDAGVKKFVFSSTCATYGEPDILPLVEDLPQAPINPYGNTKLHVEHILKDLATSGEISSAVFRYFNASGAAADGTIGEDHFPESHLIPLAIFAATGQRPALKIFGTDYPTPDGTCLRDYIHVDDLSRSSIKSTPPTPSSTTTSAPANLPRSGKSSMPWKKSPAFPCPPTKPHAAPAIPHRSTPITPKPAKASAGNPNTWRSNPPSPPPGNGTKATPMATATPKDKTRYRS